MYVLIIISALIIHPLAMAKALHHCIRTNHVYNINMINFNYDIWCSECGKIFLDEVK